MKPLRSTYPVGHLLNPATRYVPAARTNVAKTIARVKREMAERERQRAQQQERQA